MLVEISRLYNMFRNLHLKLTSACEILRSYGLTRDMNSCHEKQEIPKISASLFCSFVIPPKLMMAAIFS
jgi:hypothetical protein